MIVNYNLPKEVKEKVMANVRRLGTAQENLTCAKVIRVNTTRRGGSVNKFGQKKLLSFYKKMYNFI